MLEKYTSYNDFGLESLFQRLQNCRKAFQQGKPILVGDDGRRENEADLVFHASGATPAHVNFAITHAKGLLCVSVGPELADSLGFHSAPQFPASLSHTHFTLSVDARHHITTGVSAKDRATTISLMVDPHASAGDFITPGHVYPVRAREGGILVRAGHTEALYELCRMDNLPCAAAMCEVLDDEGNSLDPSLLASSHKEDTVFKDIPFTSSVDILWGKIFLHPSPLSLFTEASSTLSFFPGKGSHAPESIYSLTTEEEKSITLPTLISFYRREISPQTIRISMTNSLTSIDNGVPRDLCSVEISLYACGNLLDPLPHTVKDFCDLSAREGLQNTCIAVRRVVTLYRAWQFLQARNPSHAICSREFLQNIPVFMPGDTQFFRVLFDVLSMK